MDRKSVIKNFIFDKLVHHHSFDQFDNSDSLIEAGLIDSVKIMEIISFLEERYLIRITDEDIIPENFETLNAIAACVQRKIAK
jgi:acyl carrier protein